MSASVISKYSYISTITCTWVRLYRFICLSYFTGNLGLDCLHLLASFRCKWFVAGHTENSSGMIISKATQVQYTCTSDFSRNFSKGEGGDPMYNPPPSWPLALCRKSPVYSWDTVGVNNVIHYNVMMIFGLVDSLKDVTTVCQR